VSGEAQVARPQVETERLIVEMPTASDAERARSFYERNREYFRQWEPDHGDFIFTHEFWERVLPTYLDEYRNGMAMRVVLRLKSDSDGPIIGFIHFTQFAHGPLKSCTFGCNLDEKVVGNGYMNEAAGAVIAFLFDRFNMHRVNAYYRPTNIRSAKMLRRVGFQIEGYVRDYLFVNGYWRDHITCGLINPGHHRQTENFGG
jgi:ribosomal-protein-alanine N-acetyltransferase